MEFGSLPLNNRGGREQKSYTDAEDEDTKHVTPKRRGEKALFKKILHYFYFFLISTLYLI